ncbi:hypothetical protein K525DRAFT_198207 [Schizophyllum commune Loenen D]|nr:hypothetical protein K525DRAFT_198207 [Schizophyllum commune Loenen D]
MQALKEIPSTPKRVTVASHPNAITASTEDGNVKLTAPIALGKHDNMDAIIGNEAYSSNECDVAGLIEYLLPDDALPLPAETILQLINKRGKWHKDGRWCDAEAFSQPLSEARVCGFIERLCTRVRQLLKTKKIAFDGEERHWTAGFRDKSLPGGFVMRKPDIVSHKSSEECTWEAVLSDVQLKASPVEKKAVTKQLKDGGLNVLTSQDGRIFHIGVGIAGEDAFLFYQDRAGSLRSDSINLHDDPVAFLRIIIGVTFAPDVYLGSDPSIRTTESGDRELTIAGEDYRILNTVDKDAGTRGLGTVYWRCRRLSNNTEVIVKSSWIDRSRKLTEADYLDRAEAHEVGGVPTKVAFEYVTTGDGDDATRVSTSTIRNALCTAKQLRRYKFEVRDLVRLVQNECGAPLASFCTLSELLSGLADSVEAHGQLYDKAGILHTEINDQSVRLNSAAEPGARYGLLQGLQHGSCEPLEGNFESRKAGTGLRCCHPTYTACEILMASRYLPHKPRHDLESFFNVLLCQCIFYEGPEEEERADMSAVMKTLAGRWMDPDMYQAGSNKWGVLSLKRPDADTFGNFIDDTFAPYFETLKPCISELRNLVMDLAIEPTHEEFLKILRDHANSEEIRLADEAYANEKGSYVTSSPDGSQADAENDDASEDNDGASYEEQDVEGEEDEPGPDEQVAEDEEEELDFDEQAAEEGDAHDVEEYDGVDDETDAISASGSAPSSGSSAPAEPANAPSPNDVTRESSATHDTEADDPDAGRGKCLCEEVAKAGAGKRVITCKDPHCEVVLYHCRCVRRGKKSRTPAKKWRCEKCIKRGKQDPPDARRK